MPEISKARLNSIIWDKRSENKTSEIKPSGLDFVMDTMPFHAVLKKDLQKDKPLQYLCEGKYISFKPVGGTLSKGKLRANKRSVAYKDGLGSGISIEVEVSQAHWRKLIKIDSLSAIDTSQKFVEFKFLVDTDFDIPERENKKPRIKLGENSYIEISQAWDSSPEVVDEETGETSENRIQVKSFFKKVNGKLYFIKQIPTEWLKTAKFPVWTDVDIVYGSVSEFESGQADWCQCAEIDTNKFVVAYKDVDDANAGKARVGTVSGTTITWGAINEFWSNINPGKQLGVCKLATDKFVVVYAGLTADGYARVGTVSTRTISWGAEEEFETGDAEFLSCCQLETDKFAIVYDDETAGDLGTVCIATVSGDAISPGTPVAFEGNIDRVRCCKLDTDKLVAIYRDVGDSNKCKACAFTVSGTVPTPGAIKVIDANTSNNTDCAQLDTDKFVIAWNDTAGGHSAIEICTVSGTTITEYAEVELNPAEIRDIGLAKIDATHFVVVYQDLGNSNKGTSRYCSFSGTTITLGNEELFNDALTQFSDVCLISANKIAVVYQDDADVSDIGEAIIGDTPAPPVAHEKAFSDTITIGDSIVKGVGQPHSDSISIADSPVLVADFKRSFSDTVTLADAISKKPSLIKSDSLAITDAVSKQPGLIKSDSLAIVDSLVKAIGLIKSDTLNIADSPTLVADFKRSFSDTVTISDAIAKAVDMVLSDTIVISDSIVDVSEFYLAIADTVAIVDAISKKPGLVESDTIAIADSLTKAVGLNKADSITIADAVVLAAEFKRAFVDTVTISDSISKQPGLVKSDTITISDVFSKVMGFFRSFSDTILMTDSISKGISIVKADTILITDAISLVSSWKLVFSDIITIVDQAKLSYPVRKAVAIGRMAIKRIASARLPYKKIHEEDV